MTDRDTWPWDKRRLVFLPNVICNPLGVIIRDDGLAPRFAPGAVAFFNLENPAHGSFVVALRKHTKHAIVRRYLVDPDDSSIVELAALNPAVAPIRLAINKRKSNYDHTGISPRRPNGLWCMMGRVVGFYSAIDQTPTAPFAPIEDVAR